MRERGCSVDHSTINRWIIKYSPQLEAAFHKKKRRPTGRWRMDEIYIKVKGQWRYYYRAVDKYGETIDFLLTAKRDKKAALRFFTKAVGRNGKPSLANIDKNGANHSGIQLFNKAHGRLIKIRQCKYLNNIIEQDHRLIKRITKPMLGFKNFHASQKTLAGTELIRMLRKGQQKYTSNSYNPPADQFYALAG